MTNISYCNKNKLQLVFIKKIENSHNPDLIKPVKENA